MAWTEKVKAIEEKLSEACAAFDGHDAMLVFAAKLPRKDEDVRAEICDAMQPLQKQPDVTMLARLKLPVLNHGDLLVEVSLDGPEAARSRFAELVGMAGLLIPSNVQAELDRYQPAQDRMTERGRFLAWLWRLESNRLAEQGDVVWMDLVDGREFVLVMSSPFRLARLVLQCFRRNPGGQFVLPGKVKRKRRQQPVVRPLTPKQIEASKLHGECDGNIAEVARRMCCDHSTARQHLEAAFGKLGKVIGKNPTTAAIKKDRRGQADVVESDDRRR